MIIERTAEQMEEAMFGLDNPGVCLACGAEASGCEPDARNYKCEVCGKYEVFGLEEALMMGNIEIVD